MQKNTPFMLHLYRIGVWTTITQAVVDGDLSCIVHCSVTTLSTIDGQWDNENTFIKIVMHFNFLNSIHFKFSQFHFRSLKTCLCSTHTYTEVQCGVYQYTGVQCGVYQYTGVQCGAYQYTGVYSVVSTNTQGYSVVCKHDKRMKHEHKYDNYNRYTIITG